MKLCYKFVGGIIFAVVLVFGVVTLVNSQSAYASQYDHIKAEDVKLASLAVDHYSLGEFEKAEALFKKAIALAKKRNASNLFINNLKTKLGATLVQLNKFDEAQDVLQKVYKK